MDIQTDLKQLSEDYLRIEQAILYLENHYKDQPGLEEVAANVGLKLRGLYFSADIDRPGIQEDHLINAGPPPPAAEFSPHHGAGPVTARETLKEVRYAGSRWNRSRRAPSITPFSRNSTEKSAITITTGSNIWKSALCVSNSS